MQTFLPFDDFVRCARVLDNRRLGKQRVEVLQILRALSVPGYGWQHHPAVLMWSGHEEALAAYGMAICTEWARRGFADTCRLKILDNAVAVGIENVRSQGALEAARRLPPWLGNPAVHRSHQSALVRKDPDHYARLFPSVPDDLPYQWPSREEADRG